MSACRLATATIWTMACCATAMATAIFMGVFPDCYVEGKGLTPFKIVAEYVVMAAFVLTALRLRALRTLFPPHLFRLMQAAMVAAVVEEATFTLYVDVYGSLNMLGHLVQGVYAALIYLGIVRFGLAAPQEALYHQLNALNSRLAEEALRNNERAAMAVEAVDGATWEWDMVSPPPFRVSSPSRWTWINSSMSST